MNLLTVNPLHLLAGAAIATAVGFGGGWTANGWRLGAQLSDLVATGAREREGAATTALADLETGVKRVADAAKFARVDVGTINEKLDQIQKDFKNAKPPPLPPDCKPDALRVQRLGAAAAATDQAIAGRKSGGAVPGER